MALAAAGPAFRPWEDKPVITTPGSKQEEPSAHNSPNNQIHDFSNGRSIKEEQQQPVINGTSGPRSVVKIAPKNRKTVMDANFQNTNHLNPYHQHPHSTQVLHEGISPYSPGRAVRKRTSPSFSLHTPFDHMTALDRRRRSRSLDRSLENTLSAEDSSTVCSPANELGSVDSPINESSHIQASPFATIDFKKPFEQVDIKAGKRFGVSLDELDLRYRKDNMSGDASPTLSTSQCPDVSSPNFLSRSGSTSLLPVQGSECSTPLDSRSCLRGSQHGLTGRPSNHSKKAETKLQFTDFVKRHRILDHKDEAGKPIYRLTLPIRRIQDENVISLHGKFNKEQQERNYLHDNRQCISSGTAQAWLRSIFPDTLSYSAPRHRITGLLGTGGGVDENSSMRSHTIGSVTSDMAIHSTQGELVCDTRQRASQNARLPSHYRSHSFPEAYTGYQVPNIMDPRHGGVEGASSQLENSLGCLSLAPQNLPMPPHAARQPQPPIRVNDNPMEGYDVMPTSLPTATREFGMANNLTFAPFSRERDTGVNVNSNVMGWRNTEAARLLGRRSPDLANGRRTCTSRPY